jgi:hypothetical protein
VDRATLTMMLFFGCALAVAGEMSQSERSAALNKKVVGKWWSSDSKSYIEVFPNGDCTEGELYPDREPAGNFSSHLTWHVYNGKFSMVQYDPSTENPPEEFTCGSGTLRLVSPNTMTRDWGAGFSHGFYHLPVKHLTPSVR